MKVRRNTLTPTEVAAREGVARQTVTRWCNSGWIFPATMVGGDWQISPIYICARRGKSAQNTNRGVGEPLGRPKGSKNLKPYPLNVKRPRRNKGVPA